MSEPFVINTETFRNDIIEITAEGDVLTVENRLGEHSLVIDADIQIGDVVDTVDQMLVDHSDDVQAVVDDGIVDIEIATAEGLDEIQAKIDTFDPDEGTLFGHENETITGSWTFDNDVGFGQNHLLDVGRLYLDDGSHTDPWQIRPFGGGELIFWDGSDTIMQLDPGGGAEIDGGVTVEGHIEFPGSYNIERDGETRFRTSGSGARLVTGSSEAAGQVERRIVFEDGETAEDFAEFIPVEGETSYLESDFDVEGEFYATDRVNMQSTSSGGVDLHLDGIDNFPTNYAAYIRANESGIGLWQSANIDGNHDDVIPAVPMIRMIRGTNHGGKTALIVAGNQDGGFAFGASQDTWGVWNVGDDDAMSREDSTQHRRDDSIFHVTSGGTVAANGDDVVVSSTDTVDVQIDEGNGIVNFVTN